MGPHQGALETVGTASATPTPERVDAVRRRVLFLLAPSRHAALASVFFLPLPLPPSLAAAALGLSLSRVRDLFFVRPLPSSLPSSRKTLAPTSLALPSLGLPLSRSLPHRSRSHSRLFLAPSRIAPLFLSPLFRDRVAHPIPTTPMLQDAGVPPPPATGDAASPARITPRPRERSVTTKVLVKS